MKTYKVAVLTGDGIGPEVVEATLPVLESVQEGFKLKFLFREAGAHLIEKEGTNLPKKTLQFLRRTQACLKGPMTTPDNVGAPISVAVQIRKSLGLYANIRPCKTLPNISGKKGVDLIIVRENTEGMYYGKERKVPGGAIAERLITAKASRLVAEYAFRLAEGRRKKLTYVHKANILRMTDGVFNQAVLSVGKKFPEIETRGMHVDVTALQLVKKPEMFDVIVTTNLFGDVLSDEAAQITGGVGLAPSANIGKGYGMFEPVHGSAPKYEGKGIANPVAMILAGKMMLDFLGEVKAGKGVEKAVVNGLKKAKTRDIGGSSSTKKVGEVIARLAGG